MKFQRKGELLTTLENIFLDCYELDFLNAEKAYRDKKADVEFKKQQLDIELLQFERERYKTYVEYSDWKQLIEEVKKAESIEDSFISEVAEKIDRAKKILYPEECKKNQEEKTKEKVATVIDEVKLESMSLTENGIKVDATIVKSHKEKILDNFKDTNELIQGVAKKLLEDPEVDTESKAEMLDTTVGEVQEAEKEIEQEVLSDSDNKEKQALIAKAKPIKKKKPIFKFDPVVVTNKNVQLRKEVTERRKQLEEIIRKHPGITAGELRKTLGYGGGEDTRFNSDIRYLRETYLNSFLASRKIKDPPEKMAYSFDEQKQKDLNGYRDHNFTIGALTNRPKLKSDKNLY